MNRSSPTPDHVDRLLGGYFHAHLPQAWPAAPLAVKVSRQRTPVASRGRLTLAASVAALLALGGVLSYSPKHADPSAGTNLLDPATADGRKLNKHIFPDHQPKIPGMVP